MKSGMVSLIGRPNAGKSTLLNRLVGEKVAIVTSKPQTTRERILGVVNSPGAQTVFVDTPGFHRPRNALGRFMSGISEENTRDVDCAVLVVPPEPPDTREMLLIEKLKKHKTPAILAVNKCDSVPKEAVLPVIAAYAELFDFAAVLPVSALNGDGVDELLAETLKFAPEGEMLFPPDMTSDRSERAIIEEIVREKALEALDKEVPHGLAAVIERREERPDGMIIDATLFLEKDSHKGIVIGKGGVMLGHIGTLARKELEEIFGCKVTLKLWVKVKKNWRDDPVQLRKMGYYTE